MLCVEDTAARALCKAAVLTSYATVLFQAGALLIALKAAFAFLEYLLRSLLFCHSGEQDRRRRSLCPCMSIRSETSSNCSGRRTGSCLRKALAQASGQSSF